MEIGCANALITNMLKTAGAIALYKSESKKSKRNEIELRNVANANITLIPLIFYSF